MVSDRIKKMQVVPKNHPFSVLTRQLQSLRKDAVDPANLDSKNKIEKKIEELESRRDIYMRKYIETIEK